MPVTDEVSSRPIDFAVVTVLRSAEDVQEQDSGELDAPGRAASMVPFHAGVVSIEEPIMYLQAAAAAPVYSALKIETADALWFGEAEACESESNGWRIRVRLRHVLRDFDTLARLAERFGTAAPKRIPVRA